MTPVQNIEQMIAGMGACSSEEMGVTIETLQKWAPFAPPEMRAHLERAAAGLTVIHRTAAHVHGDLQAVADLLNGTKPTTEEA